MSRFCSQHASKPRKREKKINRIMHTILAGFLFSMRNIIGPIMTTRNIFRRFKERRLVMLWVRVAVWQTRGCDCLRHYHKYVLIFRCSAFDAVKGTSISSAASRMPFRRSQREQGVIAHSGYNDEEVAIFSKHAYAECASRVCLFYFYFRVRFSWKDKHA